MGGRERPSRARRAMPASRECEASCAAIAAATALALIVASQPASAQHAPPACRSSATPRSSSCCATTPRRSCAPRAWPAERAGRADQRARVQRVRDGRPAHLRERRRAVRFQDARTRSSACSRTRPATSPAGTCRELREQMANAQTASIIALLLGVGAIAAGAATRQQQYGPGRRRRDAGAAGDDPPLAPLLPARAGRSGGPRGGQVPQRDRPVRQGDAHDVQALRRRHPDRRRRASIPTSSRIRCRASASRRWTSWSRPIRTGTSSTRRSCSCATT